MLGSTEFPFHASCAARSVQSSCPTVQWSWWRQNRIVLPAWKVLNCWRDVCSSTPSVDHTRMNTSWSNSLNLKSSSGESTEFVAFCDSRAFEQVFQYSVKSTCKRSWNADSCESQIDTFEAIDVRHHFRLQERCASYRSAWSVLVPGF